MLFVDYFPYDTVGPTSDFFNNLVALENVGFYFFVSFAHELRVNFIR
jgi:hypothetical protein